MYGKKTKRNSEWDPPSPSTVYVKIKNIPYETFKTRLNEGLVSTELDQIRNRLDRHIYCCQVCSKYINESCVLTNNKTQPDWICKSFVPKEEFIYFDSRPGFENENPDGYRHLSETGIRRISNKNGSPETEDENTMLELLYQEGIALYRQGRLKLALEVFENILSKNPHHFPAMFHKGNALLKLKAYEEALETFINASKTNPDNAALWTNVGFALMKLERFKEAREAFDKSISLNPVQKNAWEGKEAVLASIGQIEEKLRESEKALKDNPHDPGVLFEKGKLHLKLGEIEDAREAFEKALKAKPENASAWELRGKILFETGLEKEALYALEKATRQKPDFPEAWYEKGKVFLKLGNIKGAENAFKIAGDLWEKKGFKTKAETARQRVKKLNLQEN
ncbi:MAG: tetratricopeptide repeat protein [Methanosarcina sp.]